MVGLSPARFVVALLGGTSGGSSRGGASSPVSVSGGTVGGRATGSLGGGVPVPRLAVGEETLVPANNISTNNGFLKSQ